MDPISQSTLSTVRRTEPLAVVSLVLGIAGWVTGLSLLVWVPGAVLGHMARARIRQDPSLEGDGLALGGLVTSYIGLALLALALVVGLLFLIFFYASWQRSQVSIDAPTQMLGQLLYSVAV